MQRLRLAWVFLRVTYERCLSCEDGSGISRSVGPNHRGAQVKVGGIIALNHHQTDEYHRNDEVRKHAADELLPSVEAAHRGTQVIALLPRKSLTFSRNLRASLRANLYRPGKQGPRTGTEWQRCTRTDRRTLRHRQTDRFSRRRCCAKDYAVSHSATAHSHRK